MNTCTCMWHNYLIFKAVVWIDANKNYSHSQFQSHGLKQHLKWLYGYSLVSTKKFPQKSYLTLSEDSLLQMFRKQTSTLKWKMMGRGEGDLRRKKGGFLGPLSPIPMIVPFPLHFLVSMFTNEKHGKVGNGILP